MDARVRAPRRLFAATVLVAGLALTGCSGGLDPANPLPPAPAPVPSPSASPPVSPSPSASPSPSVSPSTPATVQVAVRDNVFEPQVVEITAGQTVNWVWEGDAPHDVIGDGFESPIQRKGATFSHQFASPGGYGFICTLHGGMTGTVNVKAAT